MVADCGDVVSHALGEVGERQEVDVVGCLPELIRELRVQVLVAEARHAAVGVVDDDHFVGPQHLLGDDQRAQGILVGAATGVADDVGVALLQSEEAGRIEPARPCRSGRPPGGAAVR